MITKSRYVRIAVAQSHTINRQRPLRFYIDRKKHYFAVKRLMDICFSILGIVFLLSWLIPVLSLLIKMDSSGPVFFRQRRVGRGGRSFYCLKFRTMIVNADADIRRAAKEDERITKLGRFLRKTNIDELPQFLNVLQGDMSIVGPRPHMHADCALFASKVPEYKLRNLVRPGITGLSQVKGYHGIVISDECIVQRYAWDAFYIRHASLRMDIKIMTQTVWQRVVSTK